MTHFSGRANCSIDSNVVVSGKSACGSVFSEQNGHHRPKSLWLPTFRNLVTPGLTRGPAFLIYRQWKFDLIERGNPDWQDMFDLLA